MKAKAVFCDRDGTLNVDVGYLSRIEELRWQPQALEALAYLKQQGYLVIVVSNQSGVARGFFPIEAVDRLHAAMAQAVAAAGGAIAAFYYCPHLEGGAVPAYSVACNCRKPQPGLLLQAMADFQLEPEQCFLIGDGERDVEAARRAGIDGYLYPGGSLLAFVQGVLAAREAKA